MSYITLRVENKALFCRTSNLENIISSDDAPLYFKVYPYMGEKILYECELSSNMWASYDSYRNIKARIYTKSGILLKEYKYQYENDENHPDYELDEFWDYFSKYNKDSIGLIIGAGDGTWGEWVRGVNENNVKCHLVEASKGTFNNLTDIYKNIFYAKLYNLVISNNGLDCTFYENDVDDGFNTIDMNFLMKNNLSISKSEVRKTKSISELLKEVGKIDWIRFDVEGVDYDLITSISPDYFKNIKMLQYEHLHLEPEKIKIIDNILINKGFRKIVFKIDTIFIKN